MVAVSAKATTRGPEVEEHDWGCQQDVCLACRVWALELHAAGTVAPTRNPNTRDRGGESGQHRSECEARLSQRSWRQVGIKYHFYLYFLPSKTWSQWVKALTKPGDPNGLPGSDSQDLHGRRKLAPFSFRQDFTGCSGWKSDPPASGINGLTV